ERAKLVRREPDRGAGRQRNGEGRARGAETESRPDERGEDEIGDRLLRRDGEHTQCDDRGDEEGALPGAHAPAGAAEVPGPGEYQRQGDAPARRVPEPPRPAALG